MTSRSGRAHIAFSETAAPSISDGAVCVSLGVSLPGSGAACAGVRHRRVPAAGTARLAQSWCHSAPGLPDCQHLCSSAIKYLLR